MNVLLLGGTRFLGRHIVTALLARGHRVTILTRGATPDPLPPDVERLRGDRDGGIDGLAALAGRTFDACVDTCGYMPRHVRASSAVLDGAVGRYLFVSAVAVYGDPTERPVTEAHPRLAPHRDDLARLEDIDDSTYGPLKVACEDIVTAAFDERATIVRPQIVTGPHDDSDRHAYWIRRAALPGPMLGPGDGDDHVQALDVRDLAGFVMLALERGLAGPFDLAGPRVTWREFLATLGAHELRWVPAPLLAAEGLTYNELPLYRPEHGPRAGLMDVSAARALDAGLVLTPLATTLADLRASLGNREIPLALDPAREAALLARV